MDASNDWGRVAEDGTVYLSTPDGERQVASWQAGTPAQGLAHFVRRYDDLVVEIDLLAQRVRTGSADPRDCLSTINTLREGLPDAHVIGDLQALSTRLAAVEVQANAAIAVAREARAEQTRAAVERKQVLVTEAEQIAESSTAWKAGGDRLRDIVTEWSDVKGVDRATDQKMWKRLAAARDGFSRRRGTHFAQLDQQRKEAAGGKEELVAEAEKLATSTEWAPTANRMKSLMVQWKEAPRAGRDVEAALWTRFRAAQDAFFAARSAVFAERDAEFAGNEKAKIALIEQAEALDLAKLGSAQSRLRQLQEAYDAAGKVPRESMARLDARMRAAEQRVRGAADTVREKAPSTNPLLEQMREQVAKVERQLARARENGDTRAVAEHEATLATRRTFLEQAERSAR